MSILHVVLLLGAWLSAGPRKYVIEITGFEFKPASVALQAGDTVVFINRDVVPHTATARKNAWDTSTIAAGASASLVVNGKGRQDYFCRLHPAMTGRLNLR